MSVQAIAWVLDHSAAKGTARCVLISIANHVDPDGVGWVHVSRVLREANCSVGSYRSAVQEAERRGELLREGHAGGSARLHDRHRPNLFTFPALAGGDIPDRDPEPEPDRDDGGVREVFDAWREATGKDRAKLTADRRAKINARLRDGYTVADLVAAVRGVARSAWHMGENPAGVRYDDLTLVLRDGTHTERFMALSADSATTLPGAPREGLRTHPRGVSADDSLVLRRLVRPQRGCEACDLGWIMERHGRVRLCPACYEGQGDEVRGVRGDTPERQDR